MRVILTGGAGFIGSCLLARLNASGITDILVVDRLDESGKWKNLVGKVIEDYLDKDAFLNGVNTGTLKFEAEMVLHIGACTSTTETDASYLMENNYLYSKALAKWALAKNIPFLYASSAATYGDGKLGYSDEDAVSLQLKPLNMYGYSKQLFDVWAIKNRLCDRITGFKFFNVFGPNEYHKDDMRSVICKVFDSVAAGEPMRLFKSYIPEYGDGEQQRDFIYVKDAVEIVNFFIEHPDKKGIYNVGTGHARSWNDIAKALFSALGKDCRIEYIEMPQQLRDKYQYFTQADLTKLLRSGISHRFYPLEDAVKDYVQYLQQGRYI